jgi:ketosteroid isomerase-like protein
MSAAGAAAGACLAPAGHPFATPEATLRTFAVALDRGDLDTALTCIGRDACLLTPDSTAVTDPNSIRSVLSQLVAMRLGIRAELRKLVISGDLALGRGSWHGQNARPTGPAPGQNWRSTVVLKKVREEWKLQIVAPWETTFA